MIHRFIDTPQLRFHVVEAGPASGDVVLLLHGFSEFWYSWRFQIPALAAAGYRVVAPDQRGYNLTDKHGPYHVEHLAADVAHLLDALDVEASHIVGHDWGGVIAYLFAALYPQRTRRLVVMNAPHLNAYRDTWRRSWRQLLRSAYVYYFQLRGLAEWSLRAGRYRAMRRSLQQAPAATMRPEDLELYVGAWSQPGALTAMLGWYRSAFRREVRLLNRAGPQYHVSAPTCVIWGEDDVALERACNDTLARYVPDLTVHYLPETSHWVQMHRPDRVNQLLLEFL
jgi:epoxide hydrolase 4